MSVPSVLDHPGEVRKMMRSGFPQLIGFDVVIIEVGQEGGYRGSGWPVPTKRQGRASTALGGLWLLCPALTTWATFLRHVNNISCCVTGPA